VRKLSRVAPPPIRQHKSVFALGILSLVQRLDRLHQSMVLDVCTELSAKVTMLYN